jgi:SAM-dependent methyltransferase
MLASAVRNLFRRPSSHRFHAVLAALVPGTVEGPEPRGVPAKIETTIQTDWPAARLALVHRLWGSGFIFPGGEMETLRFTRPLGVSNAASLLIVGVGSGGPAIAVARDLGAWVTGMDADPSLLAAARRSVARAQQAKKVSINAWNPADPAFVPKSHHHCLALEPLHGVCAEPIIHGLTRALRSGGQMVITELAAPAPLDPTDHTVRRWAELERRDPANVLAPIAVTRMLGRVGLDVRIAEDMSERHLDHAMLGWRVMLRELKGRPTRQEALQMVREAELWLLRRRLIRDGRLRMMRWHAISR